MLDTTGRAKWRGARDRICAQVPTLLIRLGSERTGSTAIEYALTLAGIALGTSGVTAALGLDITAIFEQMQFELCQQVYSVCTGH